MVELDLGEVVKRCRVYFRDREGIEHGVFLDGVNRFHAFGRAIYRSRRCSGCNPDYREVQKMTAQVMVGQEGLLPKIVVTPERFEKWLGEAGQESRDKLRPYLLMLLDRIPPDREFKRLSQIR